MSRGRHPKPTQLRAIEGNKGKRSLRTQEPEPPLVIQHEAPEHMSHYARELWAHLVVELGKYVGVSTTDLTKLELLCEAYGRYRMAKEALWVIEKDPITGAQRSIYKTTYTTTGRNGRQEKTRPEYHHMLEEARLMHSLSAEFGMSPAARARLKGLGQRDLFDEGGDNLDALERQYAGARPGAQEAG